MIITLGTTPAVARSMIFDRLRLDAVNRAAVVHVTAAGKSVNAARVLKTLSHPCLCTGFAGGNSGLTLRAELDTEKIDHAFIDTRSATRVCVTVIDRATSSATELVEEAGSVREVEIEQLLERLTELGPRCTTLLCCGSLAPNVPEEFYATAIRTVRQHYPHVRVIVDASGAPLAATLHAGVIVKCNRAELALCVGRPVEESAQMQAAMRILIDRGAAAAVISDGVKATWVSDGKSVWQIETPPVPVVSAIGSGDSMAAGVAAGLETGATIADAARLGVACGAANAQTATPGMIDPAEVDRLLTLVTPREIASCA